MPERTVSRWGDLQPGDQTRHYGELHTVTAVSGHYHSEFGCTMMDVTWENGETATCNIEVYQSLAAPPTDRLREIARRITPELMLDLARLNNGYTRVDNLDACVDLTHPEMETVEALADDLASRADITITLPEDDHV